MTARAKIESNRRNARKSTGPRTAEGRARSAKNALRHGLFSTQVVLPGEDAEDYAAFSNQMFVHCGPVGPLEEYFVGLFITNAWKLHSAGSQLAGVIAYRASEAKAELERSGSNGNPLALGLIRDATGADMVSKLNRGERFLERGMYRALHELQRLQAARRGEDVAAPAVLDVQISSGDSEEAVK